MYPMTYASFSKESLDEIDNPTKQGLSLVWADSSNRIISVMGDNNLASWIGTDVTLAINRLLSSGWKEDSRGKVNA